MLASNNGPLESGPTLGSEFDQANSQASNATHNSSRNPHTYITPQILSTSLRLQAYRSRKSLPLEAYEDPPAAITPRTGDSGKRCLERDQAIQSYDRLKLARLAQQNQPQEDVAIFPEDGIIVGEPPRRASQPPQPSIG